MSEETTIATEPRDALKLKHPEADVSPEQPWQDDALDRKQLAERLTKLIRNEQEPFIISIDGHWGSGKTFLLKRWQRDLERDGFRAIYYNAWEDDFCDDPLLAIIGQLSEHFKESKFKKLARKAGQFAVQVIKQSVIAEASRLSGFNLGAVLSRLAGRDLLQAYLDQRESKDRLKEQLTQLSAAVAKETQRPLVFIIDELDRCRPTFAIELLERVKHIFDVPGLVFVFGVNRAEICKSLQSVYGEIDADLYLHRFFDMEFSLPVTNTAPYCRKLMYKYRLEEQFGALNGNTYYKKNSAEYNRLAQGFPSLCVRLALSLREIDYGVRFIALTARTLEEGQDMYPTLLAFLIALKLKDLTLYRQFVRGGRRASELLNFVDELDTPHAGERDFDGWLDLAEACLYAVEEGIPNLTGGSSAVDQLRRKAQGKELTHPELLSNRTRASAKDKAEWLLRKIDSDNSTFHGRSTLEYLNGLIDLQKTFPM